MSEEIVGMFAIVAVIYISILNILHRVAPNKLHIPINSVRSLGYKLSEISMMIMLLPPIFIGFAHFRPEKYLSNQFCLCGEWYGLSIVSYCASLYLTKSAYLSLIHSAKNGRSFSFGSKVFIMIFIVLGTLNTGLQALVNTGTCQTFNGIIIEYGCQIQFPEWS